MTLSPMIILSVAFGGALGAVGRLLSMRAATMVFGGGFPAGTIIVNFVGSFVMGLAVAWLSARAASDELRAFLMVGVLGAFTTFSTFSLDAFYLYRDKSMAVAGAYIAASVILSIGAFVLGLSLARSLT